MSPQAVQNIKSTPSFNERFSNLFYNCKNCLQGKKLTGNKNNQSGSRIITSPSSTVFPATKLPSSPIYSDQFDSKPESSFYSKISKNDEKGGGTKTIKSILKKPKIVENNNKYQQIKYPSDLNIKKENLKIPQWQWNNQLKEKSPYEKIIEDRVEREENCIKGKLVAVERIMRTTTTTTKNKNNNTNIYWPGYGLPRTFI